MRRTRKKIEFYLSWSSSNPILNRSIFQKTLKGGLATGNPQTMPANVLHFFSLPEERIQRVARIIEQPDALLKEISAETTIY
jgi:hypothetical protein